MFGSFLALLAAVYFLWQFRFERTLGTPVVNLGDLQCIGNLPKGVELLNSPAGSAVKLRVNQGDSPVVVCFNLPGIEAVDFLHLRFRVSANQLGPGKENWEDGRCIIEWHDPSGGPKWENDPICSVRHDQEGVIVESVVRPDHQPSIPILRLENLGHVGDLEVSLFQATAVQERWTWKIGKWILIGAWLTWACALIRGQSSLKIPRVLLAAGIWVLFGLYFVIPGPWSSYRSLGTNFILGTANHSFEKQKVNRPPDRQPETQSQSDESTLTPSVGKLAEKGDMALRIKVYAQRARPILHVALLFGPAFLIACLVGHRPALMLSIILSIAIEAAQYAFGFGFDRMDVLDLACDAVGISLALLLHRYCQIKRPGIFAR